MRRRHWLALVLAVAAVAAGLAWVHRDDAQVKRVVDEAAEADFVTRINAERASVGLSSLVVDGELTTITRRWSEQMASENVLYHNPNLKREVPQPWKRLAENVGYGRDSREVHGAFMSSSGHKANILDAGMDRVGVGVVVDAGRMWATEVFKQTGARATPVATTAPPAAAPAPTAPPARAPKAPVTTVPCARN